MAFYGKWYIGPTNGGRLRGVEVNSVEICAEKIAAINWVEWNGTQMIEVENIEITCILHEYEDVNDPIDGSIVEDKNIFNSVSSKHSIEVDFASDFSPTHHEISSQTYSNEGHEVEQVIEDDPRDIYFVLQNWTELWNTHTIGIPIYSSNYPGGIFQTSEGYEFELEIYPQECRRKEFFS